jgi:hypothetical protein
MKTKYLPLFILLSFLFLPFNASALTVDQIGPVATEGNRYTDWWISSTSFTLNGTSTDSNVTISLNDSTNYTAPVEFGKWSQTFSLNQDDYIFTVSDSNDKYTFTVHAGQQMPSDLDSDTTVADPTGTDTTNPPVPETGAFNIFAFMFSMSLLIIGTLLFKTRRENLQLFETNLVKNLD